METCRDTETAVQWWSDLLAHVLDRDDDALIDWYQLHAANIDRSVRDYCKRHNLNLNGILMRHHCIGSTPILGMNPIDTAQTHRIIRSGISAVMQDCGINAFRGVHVQLGNMRGYGENANDHKNDRDSVSSVARFHPTDDSCRQII